MGYNDHGPIHIKIVSGIAMKMLRILCKRGLVPNIVKDYKLQPQDAEIVVFLAAIMHDLGHGIHREHHEEYSIPIALSILPNLLSEVYNEEMGTIITCEVLHAMICHHTDTEPLTLEAGILKVADALDMEKGRARIPFSAGTVNIHSVSALSIEKVTVQEGKDVPLEIRIKMSNSAGIFQIDQLLKHKILNSGLKSYVKVIAEIEGKVEKKIVEKIDI